jgi:hypothetical protein
MSSRAALIAHGIADIQTVAVYRDPVEITVVLAAPSVARDRLRLLLPAGAAPLARRVTAWLTADHDLAVRLENPRPDALAASHEGGAAAPVIGRAR